MPGQPLGVYSSNRSPRRRPEKGQGGDAGGPVRLVSPGSCVQVPFPALPSWTGRVGCCHRGRGAPAAPPALRMGHCQKRRRLPQRMLSPLGAGHGREPWQESPFLHWLKEAPRQTLAPWPSTPALGRQPGFHLGRALAGPQRPPSPTLLNFRPSLPPLRVSFHAPPAPPQRRF